MEDQDILLKLNRLSQSIVPPEGFPHRIKTSAIESIINYRMQKRGFWKGLITTASIVIVLLMGFMIYQYSPGSSNEQGSYAASIYWNDRFYFPSGIMPVSEEDLEAFIGEITATRVPVPKYNGESNTAEWGSRLFRIKDLDPNEIIAFEDHGRYTLATVYPYKGEYPGGEPLSRGYLKDMKDLKRHGWTTAILQSSEFSMDFGGASIYKNDKKIELTQEYSAEDLSLVLRTIRQPGIKLEDMDGYIVDTLPRETFPRNSVSYHKYTLSSSTSIIVWVKNGIGYDLKVTKQPLAENPEQLENPEKYVDLVEYLNYDIGNN